MSYLDDLTDKTADELQSDMLDAMTLANLPTDSWQVDGLEQNFVNWVSILYQGLYQVANITARDAFLETASGQGLIDLGQGTFGTTYRIETFATGQVVVQNDSGAPLTIDAEGLTIGKVGDAVYTYRNSSAVNILNGNSDTIGFRCLVAGTGGNVFASGGPSFNVEFVTTILGVSILSHTAFVGQDAQDPAEYAELCRLQSGSLSPGGAQAAWYWFPLNLNTDGTISRLNDGKTRVNINRVRVDPENDSGVVNLVLASPTGPVDSGEYTTVVTFLEQYVLPNPGNLNASNCTAVPVNITASVELDRGTPTTGVQAALEAYVSNWFGTTDNQIGAGDGAFTIDELKLLIGRGNSKIRKVTVSAPLVDVVIADNESPQAGTISISVTVQP